MGRIPEMTLTIAGSDTPRSDILPRELERARAAMDKKERARETMR